MGQKRFWLVDHITIKINSITANLPLRPVTAFARTQRRNTGLEVGVLESDEAGFAFNRVAR
jgi:hypothetical protein